MDPRRDIATGSAAGAEPTRAGSDPDARLRWPAHAARLIGRAAERSRLSSLLAAHPIVAVYGPVGIGKTELALHVVEAEAAAGRLPAPAYVSLLGTRSMRQIGLRLAHALGRPPPAGRAQIAQGLLEWLESTPCVLVLDDVEPAAVRALAPLLRELVRWPGPWRLLLLARELLPLGALGLDLPRVDVPELAPTEIAELSDALGVGDDRSLPLGGNPLLIRLAREPRAPGPAQDDPLSALARMVARVGADGARRMVELLAAAECPLALSDLSALCGRSVEAALAPLERAFVAVRVDGAISLTAGAAPLVRAVVGEPTPFVWQDLARLAERQLERSPTDPSALLLAGSALARAGEPARALALVRAHAAARAACPGPKLARLLDQLAAIDPRLSPEVGCLLAHEQLRCGECELALATLERIPVAACDPALAQRVHALRATALVTVGERALAEREVARARPGPDHETRMAEAFAAAGLAVLRGEFSELRRTLLTLGRARSGDDTIAIPKAALLAATYLLEQRLDLAAAWARRARRSARLGELGRLASLTGVLEVVARLGLDQIDRASAIAGRDAAPACADEVPGNEAAGLIGEALAWRRGEFAQTLTVAEWGLPLASHRLGRLAHAVLAHYVAQAALGLGQLDRAESLLRAASAAASETGFSAFAPILELDLARLFELRGRFANARTLAERAHARAPRNPFAAIEVQALAGMPPDAVIAQAARGPASLRAYAALRAAECGLARAQLSGVGSAVAIAEEWYRQAGAQHELARALLAGAELHARRGAEDAACSAIARCEAIATPRGYQPVLVAAALVRAFLADRAGRLEHYVEALATARAHGSGELWDAALRQACERVGLDVFDLPPATAVGEPWRDRVARLGLGRRAAALLLVGPRLALVDEVDRITEPYDLWVDLLRGEVRRGRARLDLSREPLLLKLLAFLATVGAAGSSLEQIHRHVWGLEEYHPLRDRNRIYVAVSRLKTALRALGAREWIEKRLEGRYLLPRELQVAVLHPVARHEQRSRLVGSRGARPADALAHALAFGLPLAEARWDLALLEADPRS